ncbi:hypothetical protein GOP47_0013323 [Adiantum capillus-veneris]|uniref:RING-type E3 ubiquitin transferase n=1 Tax=Adiantum capillus-veneris TaxID=13818 RepID=A0A9D4UNU4_ADICA|nr:hypothetical protein GOP47_0013323 [Adiantum capillus-veneris]
MWSFCLNKALQLPYPWHVDVHEAAFWLLRITQGKYGRLRRNENCTQVVVDERETHRGRAETKLILTMEEIKEDGGIGTTVLFASLLSIVNEITRLSGFHQSHKRECINLVRRIKLMQPLFEEMKESPPDGSNPAVAVFQTLEVVLQSAKTLLQSCIHGSKIYLVLEHRAIAKEFSAVSNEMETALKGMPWSILDISEDVREQVDFVQGQFNRAKEQADLPDSDLYKDLVLAITQQEETVFDTALLCRLADRLQLRTPSQLDAEVHAVQDLIRKCTSKVNVSLQEMLELLMKLKKASAVGAREGETFVCEESPSSSDVESSCEAAIPDDYLCPISLEIMKDPVIVATGQTYERANIQKWLEENRTCPKTSQILPHTTLTPNFVLRSLINQWCEAHGLEIATTSSPSETSPFLSAASLKEGGTIDGLVDQLRSGQLHLARAAAVEIRLLAKDSTENRVRIAEAGAIPYLVTLLSTHDAEAQENAVTALLNLSIHENIKGAVVQAGAIPPIVKVLKCGSMEARENAAATLFSLSSVNENKLTIGALGAIPPLVDLLKNGSPQGRKDAASALFNLLIYQGNKPRAVRAGVVIPILNLLMDSSTGMMDEAVSILAVLATHQEGRRAIGRLGVKRFLVELSESGTERAKRKASSLLEHLAMLQAECAKFRCEF